MNNLLRILIPVFLLSYSIQSLAHHSWRAVYGDGEEVELIATVTSEPQRRPHWNVTVELTNQEGEAEEWNLQWRNRRGENREEDQILAVLRTGEDFEVIGQKSHLPNNNQILIREITRLSDGMTAVSNRD